MRLCAYKPLLAERFGSVARRNLPTAEEAAALGTAVHEALATLDLADEDRQAQLEALGLSPEARAHVERVWQGDWGELIAQADEHWREVEIRLPLAGATVVGAVDLVVRTGQDFQVIDFKTSPTADLEKHRSQLQAYGLAVAEAFGTAHVTCGMLRTSDGALFYLPETEARDFRQELEALGASRGSDRGAAPAPDLCAACEYYHAGVCPHSTAASSD
jgi:ATP-dependent exoDNAse (exonuclease V) beta subunit